MTDEKALIIEDEGVKESNGGGTANDNKPITILLVDDNDEDRKWYKRLLENKKPWGCEFLEAKTGQIGLDLCEERRPDCILLDYRLPDLDGLEFLSRLKEIHYAGLVILLTGQGNEAVAVEAMKKGTHDYFVKDALSSEVLIKTIKNGLKEIRLSESRKRGAEQFKSYANALKQDISKKNEMLRVYRKRFY